VAGGIGNEYGWPLRQRQGSRPGVVPDNGGLRHLRRGRQAPDRRVRSALGELVEKGFVSAEELKSGGVFYRPNASFGHLAEWARERADTRVEIWRRKGDGNAPCSAPSAEAGTEPVGTDLTSVLGGDRFS
jgi:hypothetical protein